MATTSVRMPWRDGTVRNLQFVTEQFETGLYVAVHICDQNWVYIDKWPGQTTDPRTEEEYHRELRSSSSQQGHFVPQYSTDPEWNPGYLPPIEETDEGSVH